jgi:hypothetical protein
MEAIILTSEQFDTLKASIDEIKRNLSKPTASNEVVFIDNQEFIDLMKISPRTAQKWRDEGVIAFSQIGNKIYYRMKDVQLLLDKNYNKAIN